MMNVLIINAGSTSLKFSVYLISDEDYQLTHTGQFDKINEEKYTLKFNGEKRDISYIDFQYSVWRIREELLPNENFDLIGFRVVHGGERFVSPTLLNKDVIKELEELSELAPLHNPPAVDKIKQALDAFPDIPKYAVFDTEFHSTIPEKAYLYALPYRFYKDYKIRRYGFHGISHEYLYQKLQNSNIKLQNDKVITCHLGGGASITAIKDGKSIDTSMGFTPMEGIVMATRTGDVDDGVQNYLEQNIGMSEAEIHKIFNKESGLLGLSETTSDMKKLIEMYNNDQQEAVRTIDVYIYRIQKYIGSYIAALGGLDALIFSGGVGSGSDFIRKKVCDGLENFGIEIDDSVNEGQIDVEDILEIGKGKVKIFAIKTNEELMIAKKIVSKANNKTDRISPACC